MSHPDEGMIHAWLDGELEAIEAARIEALVKSDPAWSAAAAEARGFIAASSRIVSSLDDVPAHVIPAGSKRAPAAPLVVARPRRFNRNLIVGLAVAASLLLVVQLVPPEATIETKSVAADGQPQAPSTAAAPAESTTLSARAAAPAITPVPRPAERRRVPSEPAPAAANEREVQGAARRDAAGRDAAPAAALVDAMSRQQGASGQGAAGGAAQALASGVGAVQTQSKDADQKLKESDSLAKKVGDQAQKLEAVAPTTECYREEGTQAVVRVARTTDSTATLVERLEPQPGATGARTEFRSNRGAVAPAPAATMPPTTAFRVKGDTLFAASTGGIRRATRISCTPP